jgi:dTDP-glucose 4,6-dehydratase
VLPQFGDLAGLRLAVAEGGEQRPHLGAAAPVLAVGDQLAEALAALGQAAVDFGLAVAGDLADLDVGVALGEERQRPQLLRLQRLQRLAPAADCLPPLGPLRRPVGAGGEEGGPVLAVGLGIAGGGAGEDPFALLSDRQGLVPDDRLQPLDQLPRVIGRGLEEKDLEAALQGVFGVVGAEGESVCDAPQIRLVARVDLHSRPPAGGVGSRPQAWLGPFRANRLHCSVLPCYSRFPYRTLATPSTRGKRLSPHLDECPSGKERKLQNRSEERPGGPRLDRLRPVSTCVVTGGAGFLGSHLCERLLGDGHRVICLDNLETGSLENIAHIRDDAFEFRHIDITNYVDLPEDVDFVYHLASPASPIDYLRLPLHTLKVGSHGTHHMLGVAKWKRARFLIASTSEVYGDPKVHPQREDYWGHVNPIGPRGVYDEAKRYAEALTMAYHRQQGVDTAIVRIFNTYGPRMRAHDGRAIPTFLRQALQDRPITVFGDGSQTRSFCYVDDLIDGIVKLAESDAHMPVNIGNPNEFTLLELAKAVIEVTDSRSEIIFEPLPTDDPQQRQPDIGRARDLLGWEPQVELNEGLRRTIDQSGIERLVGAGD